MTDMPSSSQGSGSYTPPPPPVPPTGGDVPSGTPTPPGSDRTVMLILSYLWLLAIIPLVTKKEDRDLQWHAKNGLAFAIGFTGIAILLSVIGWVLPGWASCGLVFVQCGLGIGYLVVTILAIMKAMNGQRFRLPFVSDFADKM